MTQHEHIIRFFLIALALALTLSLSHIWYVKKDVTQDGLYTLSSYTDEVLNSLDSKVEISYFRSSLFSAYTIESSYIFDTLSLFENHKSQICILKLYNADEVEEKKLISLGLASQTVQEKRAHSTHETSIYSGIVIQLKGLSRTIPFVASTSHLEYDIVNSILQINREIAKKSLCVSLIFASPLKEEEEVTPYLRQWLEYAGFNITEFSLPLNEELPIDCPLIVVGSTNIDASSATLIDAFLKKKGNALFFVSANVIDVNGDWSVKKKKMDSLMEVLYSMGVEIESNLVLDISNFPLKMMEEGTERSRTINYPLWPTVLMENMNHASPLFSSIITLQTFWPSSMKITQDKKDKFEILATTTEQAVVMEKDYNIEPFSQLFSLFEGREKKRRPLIVLQEKPNRVLVVSDENMVSGAIEYTLATSNLDFVVNTALYLSKKDALLSLKAKNSHVRPFRFYDEGTFNFIIWKARILCFIATPLLILLLYLFIRKRGVKNDIL